MTDSELLKQINSWRSYGESELLSIRRLGDDLLKFVQERVVELVTASGKRVCPGCQGHGMLPRLDAGVMARFGLRQWNGCNVCGGNGNDVSGRGFLNAT